MPVSFADINADQKWILKLFLITLAIMIIVAVIIAIGAVFHNTNVTTFFEVTEGLLFGFMILIGAEELELLSNKK
jgi:hypothetical protein